MRRRQPESLPRSWVGQIYFGGKGGKRVKFKSALTLRRAAPPVCAAVRSCLGVVSIATPRIAALERKDESTTKLLAEMDARLRALERGQ